MQDSNVDISSVINYDELTNTKEIKEEKVFANVKKILSDQMAKHCKKIHKQSIQRNNGVNVLFMDSKQTQENDYLLSDNMQQEQNLNLEPPSSDEENNITQKNVSKQTQENDYLLYDNMKQQEKNLNLELPSSDEENNIPQSNDNSSNQKIKKNPKTQHKKATHKGDSNTRHNHPYILRSTTKTQQESKQNNQYLKQQNIQNPQTKREYSEIYALFLLPSLRSDQQNNMSQQHIQNTQAKTQIITQRWAELRNTSRSQCDKIYQQIEYLKNSTLSIDEIKQIERIEGLLKNRLDTATLLSSALNSNAIQRKLIRFIVEEEEFQGLLKKITATLDLKIKEILRKREIQKQNKLLENTQEGFKIGKSSTKDLNKNSTQEDLNINTVKPQEITEDFKAERQTQVQELEATLENTQEGFKIGKSSTKDLNKRLDDIFSFIRSRQSSKDNGEWIGTLAQKTQNSTQEDLNICSKTQDGQRNSWKELESKQNNNNKSQTYQRNQ